MRPIHLRALAALLVAGGASALRPLARRGFVAGAVLAPVAPLPSRAAAGAAPKDAFFPAAIYEGDFLVGRKINVMEGDAAAAEAAWRAVGNAGPYELLKKGTYATRFVAAPDAGAYAGSAEKFPEWASAAEGLVAEDRAYEMEARGASAAKWTGEALTFTAADGRARSLRVVDRRIEDIGRGQVGFTETYLIDGGSTAVKLARGYRPAPGAPMFGGVEMLTTYDVVNGAVGTAPTSTTKSRLQYERSEVAERTGFGKSRGASPNPLVF